MIQQLIDLMNDLAVYLDYETINTDELAQWIENPNTKRLIWKALSSRKCPECGKEMVFRDVGYNQDYFECVDSFRNNPNADVNCDGYLYCDITKWKDL